MKDPLLIVKAHAPGTIPVKQVVHKEGYKPFMQTFWVAPEKVEEVKAKEQTQDHSLKGLPVVQQLRISALLSKNQGWHITEVSPNFVTLYDKFNNHVQVFPDGSRNYDDLVTDDTFKAPVGKIFANWNKVKDIIGQISELDLQYQHGTTISFDEMSDGINKITKDLFYSDKDSFIAVMLNLQQSNDSSYEAVWQAAVKKNGWAYKLDADGVFDPESPVINVRDALHQLAYQTTDKSLFAGSDSVTQESIGSLLTTGWKSSSRSMGGQLLQYYLFDTLKEKGVAVNPPSYFTHHPTAEVFKSFIDWARGTQFEALLKDEVKEIYEKTQDEIANDTSIYTSRLALSKEAYENSRTELWEHIHNINTRIEEKLSIKKEAAQSMESEEDRIKYTAKYNKLRERWYQAVHNWDTAFTTNDFYETKVLVQGIKDYFYEASQAAENDPAYFAYLHISRTLRENLERSLADLEETHATWYKYIDESTNVPISSTLTLYRGVEDEYNVSSTLESWTSEQQVADTFDGYDILQKEVPKSAIYTYWNSKNWRHKREGSVYEQEKEYIVITDLLPKTEKIKEELLNGKSLNTIASDLVLYTSDNVYYPSNIEIEWLMEQIHWPTYSLEKIQALLKWDNEADINTLVTQLVRYRMRAKEKQAFPNKSLVVKSDYQRMNIHHGKLVIEQVHDKRVHHEIAKTSVVSQRADNTKALNFETILAENPKLIAKQAESVKSYTGFKVVKDEEPTATVKRLINHLSNNLEWLYKQIPPEVSEHTKKWYVGANKVAGDWSKKYDLTKEQTAGVIACMSPQLEWFQNLHLAQHVIETYKNNQDTPWNDGMAQYLEAPIAAELKGKTLAQLDDLALRASWVLAYNKSQPKTDVEVYSPEGEQTGKTSGKTSWFTSVNIISKALNILEGSSVSGNLSNAHKVRNFYNNIISPENTESVTIDTHAVAAAYLSPLGSMTEEVLHNFGAGGISRGDGALGTYYITADAYRKAAKKLGILPRELQSATWEFIREKFANKRSHDAKEVMNVWNSYKQGKLSLDAARTRVTELWQSSDKADEKTEHTVNQGKLHKGELWADSDREGLGARTDSRTALLVVKSDYYRTNIHNGKVVIEHVHDRRVKTEADTHSHANKLLDEATANLHENSQWLKAHSQRTGVLAGKVAKEMGLSDREAQKVINGALLHDVGKMDIATVESSAELNTAQIEEMHRHPVLGSDMLAAIPELVHASKGVRHHHEHVDGSGYPDKLKADDIPLEARIIAVADAFDAITNTRPYHQGDTIPNAVAELKKNAGKQFDIRVVDALISVLRADHLLPLVLVPLERESVPQAGWYYNLKANLLVPLNEEKGVHGDWIMKEGNAAKLGIDPARITSENSNLPELIRIRMWPDGRGNKRYLTLSTPYSDTFAISNSFKALQHKVEKIVDQIGYDNVTKIVWIDGGTTHKLQTYEFLEANNPQMLLDPNLYTVSANS